MNYYDAVKNNWRAFGDVEEIAYADAEGETIGVKARQVDPDAPALAQSNGLAAFSGSYATFVLWDATLAGKQPQTGGVITQTDGAKWTVQTVKAAQWNSQWHCRCVRHVA